MARDKTLKEAMVSHALEEIEGSIERLEAVSNQVKDLSDTLPAYFEEASNEVSDIIKRGVDADLNNARERLKHAHKEVSNSIELQRKLNVQLKMVTKAIDDHNTNKQALIFLVASFFGGFLAVVLSKLLG